jgi:hypothetical protein
VKSVATTPVASALKIPAKPSLVTISKVSPLGDQ